MLAAAAIVINTVVTQPRSVLFAIALMVLGLPAYYLWRGRLAKIPADTLQTPETTVTETV
jgi:Flp pilus assembly protein TadB